MRETYELINNRQATPQRLHALVRLVARLDKPDRQTLADYLQPAVLVDNQNAFSIVYRAGINCQLLREVDEGIVLADDLASKPNLDAIDTFRRVMQDRLLGVTNPDQDHYLLSLLAAWWAAQDTLIFDLNNKKEIEIQFNKQLFPEEKSGIETGRAINTTKLTHWLEWASFLGWGWMYQGLLMPDARKRLLPCLQPLRGQSLSFGAFMKKLASACPELDTGSLFTQAWQASHGGRQRGQRISLMLSTALRVLHTDEVIRLRRQADATDMWQLHDAEGYDDITDVSHIEIRG